MYMNLKKTMNIVFFKFFFLVLSSIIDFRTVCAVFS